uniref:separase n=1 Tax=Arcella intermedia TaxID=1963864 RepID=A0A6B2LH30_9EUKA
MILDKHLHQIPFESFPILRNMSVTRMPSLIFTKARLELNSTLKCKPDVSLKRAYYIVNPDGSLEKTEQCVLPILKKLGLNRGLVGSTPKSSVSEVFLSALQKEILIYCGHNSGEQYVKREDIQKLDHCAVSLLMGCSSLSLEGSIDSDFEPEGTPSNYFLANCTATAGNLWVVTDKDLDTVTCSLLSDWADHSNKWSLLDCVPLAREKCKLPYLNGAALIHYGFPMYCKKE